MRAALVTGAAGFIGSHLVERLLANEVPVIGVDALTPAYDPALKRQNLEPLLSNPNYTHFEHDLASRGLDGIPEFDRVYHLAAQAGVRESWGSTFEIYTHHNIVATQVLFEELRKRPVDRVVFASSSSVYGDAEAYPTSETLVPRPISPYGVTKLAGEHLAYQYHRLFELPVIPLRFFTVYGPRQRPDMAFRRFLTAHLARQPLEIFGDGTQSRDFTFIDDCIDGILAAGERGEPGEIYNLGSGKTHSILEVCRVLAEISGREPELHTGPAVPGDVVRTAADPAKAREALGFEPKRSLRDGLTSQWQWLQSLDRPREGVV